MIEIDKIVDSKYAIYIGKTDTCLSCRFRYNDLLELEPKMPNWEFYYINPNKAQDIINKYQITKIPFFIISVSGSVKSIFYEYKDLLDLFYKMKREE